MGKCLFMRKGSVHTAPSSLIKITVNVTDAANALDAILNIKGVLTVSTNKITSSSTSLTVLSDVEVSYKLTSALGTARIIVVNGLTIGTVSASGDTVSTIIDAVDGDLITIQFNKS